MKYTTILASITLGLGTLISTGCVGDVAPTAEYYHHHGYDGEYGGTDFRDKVRHLRDHYARVREEAEYRGVRQRFREELHGIRDGIDRVAGFVFSGEYNPDRAQENISKLHAELRNVSDEIRACQ